MTISNYFFYLLASFFLLTSGKLAAQTTRITLSLDSTDPTGYRLYDSKTLFAHQPNKTQELVFLKEKKRLEVTTFPTNTEILYKGLDSQKKPYYILHHQINQQQNKKETLILTPGQSICALKGDDSDQFFVTKDISSADELLVYISGTIKDREEQGAVIYFEPSSRCTNEPIFVKMVDHAIATNTTILATYPLSSTKEVSILQYNKENLLLAGDTQLLNGDNWAAFYPNLKLQGKSYLAAARQLNLLVKDQENGRYYLVQVAENELKSYQILHKASTTISGLATDGKRHFFYGTEQGKVKIFTKKIGLSSGASYLFSTLSTNKVYSFIAEENQISFLHRIDNLSYWILLPGYHLLNQTKGCVVSEKVNDTLQILPINNNQLFDFSYNRTYPDSDLNPLLDNQTLFYKFASSPLNYHLDTTLEKTNGICLNHKKSNKSCRRDTFIERTFLCSCANHCAIFWVGMLLIIGLLSVGVFVLYPSTRFWNWRRSKRGRENRGSIEKKLKQMINQDQEHSITTLSNDLENESNLIELSEL